MTTFPIQVDRKYVNPGGNLSASGYYRSHVTQQIANMMPPWMHMRENPRSRGQQFLSPMAMELNKLEDIMNDQFKNKFITTAPVDEVDVLYKMKLPSNIDLTDASASGIRCLAAPSGSSPSGVNNIWINEVDNLEAFYYHVLPTRLEVSARYNLVDDFSSSCIAHWKLNENAADTIITDSSGKGHNGVAERNTNLTTTTGKINTAYGPNGSSDFITISNHADFEFGDGSADVAFSVAGWLNVADDPTGQKIAALASTWVFGLDSNERPFLQLRDASVPATISIKSGAVLSLGWHYIAITYDGRGGADAADGMEVYVDNVLISSPVRTNNANYVAMQVDGNDITLCAESGSAFYNGDLDDLRIYNKVLSLNEIRNIYNFGNGTEELMWDPPTTAATSLSWKTAGPSGVLDLHQKHVDRWKTEHDLTWAYSSPAFRKQDRETMEDYDTYIPTAGYGTPVDLYFYDDMLWWLGIDGSNYYLNISNPKTKVPQETSLDLLASFDVSNAVSLAPSGIIIDEERTIWITDVDSRLVYKIEPKYDYYILDKNNRFIYLREDYRDSGVLVSNT